jgi:hypothetical protein
MPGLLSAYPFRIGANPAPGFATIPPELLSAFARFVPHHATRARSNDIDTGSASINQMEMKMNRARYRVVQDFLHVVMIGVVTGVLFSMAVTGVVFLISGHAHA